MPASSLAIAPKLLIQRSPQRLNLSPDLFRLFPTDDSLSSTYIENIDVLIVFIQG